LVYSKIKSVRKSLEEICGFYFQKSNQHVDGYKVRNFFNKARIT